MIGPGPTQPRLLHHVLGLARVSRMRRPIAKSRGVVPANIEAASSPSPADRPSARFGWSACDSNSVVVVVTVSPPVTCGIR